MPLIHEGEEGVSNNKVKNIRVEAKIFNCSPLERRFVLMESPRKWIRYLLTLEHAIWIPDGLHRRSKEFQKSRCKESKLIDGVVVVLVEGKNTKGVFLSTHL